MKNITFENLHERSDENSSNISDKKYIIGIPFCGMKRLVHRRWTCVRRWAISSSVNANTL